MKHTEGGDFRQATYRAVRQGLMRGRKSAAGAIIMSFRLEIPAENRRTGHDGYGEDVWNF